MPGLRPVRNIGFSSDGSEIWFGGAPVDRMRIMPMMGGPPRPFLVDRAAEVVWSSDGARMVYHTDAPGDPMFRRGSCGRRRQTDSLWIRLWDGTAIIRGMVADGRWVYFAGGLQDTRQMDVWRIAAWRRATGTPHLSQRVCGFPDADRRSKRSLHRAGSRRLGPWLWALDTNSRATRRVAYGTEQYLSIAASADRRRLWQSVANPSASLWTVPILESPCRGRDAKAMALPTCGRSRHGLPGDRCSTCPRRARVTACGVFEDGKAVEILKGSDEALFEPAGGLCRWA